jgi:uncharacterized protein involved in exopolysaccharide biosynthesis
MLFRGEIMRRFRVLVVLAIAPAMAGCIAAWGSSYKVEFESSSMITIDFDPSATTMGNIQGVAQQHCDKYGKDAIPQSSDTSYWGIRSASFLCQSRT